MILEKVRDIIRKANITEVFMKKFKQIAIKDASKPILYITCFVINYISNYNNESYPSRDHPNININRRIMTAIIFIATTHR